MNCNICGRPLNDMGNNPYPLCVRDDTESRCCDDCNNYVINARIISMKGKYQLKDANPGDTLVIFAVSDMEYPTTFLKDRGKFLAGIIEKVEEKDGKYIAYGNWGPFSIEEDDSYLILK